MTTVVTNGCVSLIFFIINKIEIKYSPQSVFIIQIINWAEITTIIELYKTIAIFPSEGLIFPLTPSLESKAHQMRSKLHPKLVE